RCYLLPRLLVLPASRRVSSPLSAASPAALSCGSDTPPVTSANSPVPDRPPSETEVTDLTTEYAELREEVQRLKDQLMCVLDHAIESDTRLHQYTDQVFVANTSRHDSSIRASTTDCGAQCDLPSECRDQRCAESRDLVDKLKVTLEVLKAELQSLRGEMTRFECDGGGGVSGSEWTVCSKKRPPVATKNKYDVLRSRPVKIKGEKLRKRFTGNRLQHRNQQKETITLHKEPLLLSFSSVLIDGDVHSPCLEVLKAELQSLRGEMTRFECDGGGGVSGSEWTVCSKKRPPQRQIRKTLRTGRPVKIKGEKLRKRFTGNRLQHRNQQKETITLHKEPLLLSFSSVLIDGDVHSRGLAGLVQRMVARKTMVKGMCKPGAKLLDVTSDRPPPAGCCSVIIAGTKDVPLPAEQHIPTSGLRSVGVVVATLPHLHDLPARNPVHLETARVNSYIEELCVRHGRAEGGLQMAWDAPQAAAQTSASRTFAGKREETGHDPFARCCLRVAAATVAASASLIDSSD
ncbi:hypothetical protein J6590_104267, partial [Homalodisca vitripennis]